MTTALTTTAISHTTDAEFRTWGLELSNMLTSVGLPKTADSGQVDWTTATRPATSSYVYEIRYLNDSLHASRPCYIKIEYGTGTVATYPQIRISCATSTNGSGTLSGTTLFSPTLICSSIAPRAGNWPTGAIAIPGFAGFFWKREGQFAGNGPHFFVGRLTDSSGTPTTAGFVFYFFTSTNCNRNTVLGSTSYADVNGFALFPGALAATSTLVSGAPQVMRHFVFTPEIQVMPFMLSYVNSEIGDLSTFTHTPVGVTPRTYLALGTAPVNCGLSPNGALSTARLAIQWE